MQGASAMCGDDDDAWMSLGAIAAQVVKGAAPAPQGGGDAGAGARGNKPGVKRLCRAHHRGYGEGRTATILMFPVGGRARPNTSPATIRELHRITGEGLDPSGYPPADGRLVNARRAKHGK